MKSIDAAKSIRALLSFMAIFALFGFMGLHLDAQGEKPNILFIMGDDVGWFNIGAYHQGMMAGRTNRPELRFGGFPCLF